MSNSDEDDDEYATPPEHDPVSEALRRGSIPSLADNGKPPEADTVSLITLRKR